MNRMCRWLAMALTIAMLLGCAVSAWADEAAPEPEEDFIDVTVEATEAEETPEEIEGALAAEAGEPLPEDEEAVAEAEVAQPAMAAEAEQSAPNAEGVAVSPENFPDSNFRGYVSAAFDADGNGYLSDSEIAAATTVSVDEQSISTLQGIGYLTALTRLNCRYNYLGTLDLSKNTALEYLWCDGNYIEVIDLTHNQKVVDHILDDGPVRGGSRIRFMTVDSWTEKDPNLIFDDGITLVTDGVVIYSKDMAITRDGPSASIGVGEKLYANAVGNTATTKRPLWYAELFDNTCTYKSSDSKVAKVNANGRITGVKAGTAYITVKGSNGISAMCEINVAKAPTSVKVSSKKLSIMVGNSKPLTATLSAGANSYAMKWTTSNKKVATYDAANQKVVAVGKGTATITVKTFNGRTARCRVTVTAPAPTSVSLGVDELSIHINETFLLEPVIDSGTSTTFSYSSSNKKVATVSSKGIIKGKKAGTATITVKTKNGLTDTVVVEVDGKMTARKTYVSGTSGIDVYTGTGSPYFHSHYACEAVVDAVRVTLEDALNKGLLACPICMPEGNTKVYALAGGSYYHLRKKHVGSGVKTYTLSVALASGMVPCPICAAEK